MKVTFNRNIKHDGVLYLQGHPYQFEGELSEDLKDALDLTHGDGEQTVEMKTAEEAAGEKTGSKPQPAMPPAPKV